VLRIKLHRLCKNCSTGDMYKCTTVSRSLLEHFGFAICSATTQPRTVRSPDVEVFCSTERSGGIRAFAAHAPPTRIDRDPLRRALREIA